MAGTNEPKGAGRTLVSNERLKLVATFLNTLGSGSILAGVVIPAAAILVGTLPASANLSNGRLALVVAIWFSVGGALHLIASYLIGRLRP